MGGDRNIDTAKKLAAEFKGHDSHAWDDYVSAQKSDSALLLPVNKSLTDTLVSQGQLPELLMQAEQHHLFKDLNGNVLDVLTEADLQRIANDRNGDPVAKALAHAMLAKFGELDAADSGVACDGKIDLKAYTALHSNVENSGTTQIFRQQISGAITDVVDKNGDSLYFAPTGIGTAALQLPGNIGNLNIGTDNQIRFNSADGKTSFVVDNIEKVNGVITFTDATGQKYECDSKHGLGTVSADGRFTKYPDGTQAEHAGDKEIITDSSGKMTDVFDKGVLVNHYVYDNNNPANLVEYMDHGTVYRKDTWDAFDHSWYEYQAGASYPGNPTDYSDLHKSAPFDSVTVKDDKSLAFIKDGKQLVQQSADSYTAFGTYTTDTNATLPVIKVTAPFDGNPSDTTTITYSLTPSGKWTMTGSDNIARQVSAGTDNAGNVVFFDTSTNSFTTIDKADGNVTVTAFTTGDKTIQNADGSTNTFHFHDGHLVEVDSQQPNLAMHFNTAGAMTSVDLPDKTTLVPNYNGGWDHKSSSGELLGTISGDLSVGATGKLQINNKELQIDATGKTWSLTTDQGTEQHFPDGHWELKDSKGVVIKDVSYTNATVDNKDAPKQITVSGSPDETYINNNGAWTIKDTNKPVSVGKDSDGNMVIFDPSTNSFTSIDQSGHATIEKFQNADKSITNSDGSVSTYHFTGGALQEVDNLAGSILKHYDGKGNTLETDFVTWDDKAPHDMQHATIHTQIIGDPPSKVVVTDENGKHQSFELSGGTWQHYDADHKLIEPALKSPPVIDARNQSVTLNYADGSIDTFLMDGLHHTKGKDDVTAKTDGDHVEKNTDSGAEMTYGTDNHVHAISWDSPIGDAQPSWTQDKQTQVWDFTNSTPPGRKIEGPKNVVGDPIPHKDGSVTFKLGDSNSVTYDKYGHIIETDSGSHGAIKRTYDYVDSSGDVIKKVTQYDAGKVTFTEELVVPNTNPPTWNIYDSGHEIRKDNLGHPIVITGNPKLDSQGDLTFFNSANPHDYTVLYLSGAIEKHNPDNSWDITAVSGARDYHSADGIEIKFDANNNVIAMGRPAAGSDLAPGTTTLDPAVVDRLRELQILSASITNGGFPADANKQITEASLKAWMDPQHLPALTPDQLAVANDILSHFNELSTDRSTISADSLDKYSLQVFNRHVSANDGSIDILSDGTAAITNKLLESSALANLAQDAPILRKVSDGDHILKPLVDQEYAAMMKDKTKFTQAEIDYLTLLHNSFYQIADARGVLTLSAVQDKLRQDGDAPISDERLKQIATDLVHNLAGSWVAKDPSFANELETGPLTLERINALMKEYSKDDARMSILTSLHDSFNAIISRMPAGSAALDLNFLATEAGYPNWQSMRDFYSDPTIKSTASTDGKAPDTQVVTRQLAGDTKAIEVDYKGSSYPDAKTIVNYADDQKSITEIHEPNGSIIKLKIVANTTDTYLIDGKLAQVTVDKDTGVVTIDYHHGHKEVINADGTRSVTEGDGKPTVTYSLDAQGKEHITTWQLGTQIVNNTFDPKTGELLTSDIGGPPHWVLHRNSATEPWALYADKDFKAKIADIGSASVDVGVGGITLSGPNSLIPGWKYDILAANGDVVGLPTALGLEKPTKDGGWQLTKTADQSVVLYDKQGRVTEVDGKQPPIVTKFNYPTSPADSVTPDSVEITGADHKKQTITGQISVDNEGTYTITKDAQHYELVTTNNHHELHDQQLHSTVITDAFGHTTKIISNDTATPPIVRTFEYQPPDDPNGKPVKIVNPDGSMWLPDPNIKDGWLHFASNGKDPIYGLGAVTQESMVGAIQFDSNQPGSFTIGDASHYPIRIFSPDGHEIMYKDLLTKISSDAFGHVTEVSSGAGSSAQTRQFGWLPADSMNGELVSVTEPDGTRWTRDQTDPHLWHHVHKSPDDTPILLGNTPEEDRSTRTIDHDGVYRIQHDGGKLDVIGTDNVDAPYAPLKPVDAPIAPAVNDKPTTAPSSFVSDAPKIDAPADSAFDAANYLNSFSHFTFMRGIMASDKSHKRIDDSIDMSIVGKQQAALASKQNLSADEKDQLATLNALIAYGTANGNPPVIKASDFISAGLLKQGADATGVHVLKPGDTIFSMAQNYLTQHGYNGTPWAQLNPQQKQMALNAEQDIIRKINHISGSNLAVGEVFILDPTLLKYGTPEQGLAPTQINSKVFTAEQYTNGVEHHVNSHSGEEYYKLSNGLLVTKSKDGTWTAYDKSGNSLGTVENPDDLKKAKDSEVDLKLKPSSNSLVKEIDMLADGTTRLVCSDNTTELDYRNGEKVHLNVTNVPDLVRLPDGSTIQNTATGYIYTDAAGHQHSVDAMPKIDLATGALTLTVKDGQTSQVIAVGPDGTMTTTSSDNHVEKRFKSGLVEDYATAGGQQSNEDIKLPSGLRFHHSDKGWQIWTAAGVDTGLATNSAIVPSPDGSFTFQITDQPDLTFKVDAAGNLSCTSSKMQSLMFIAQELLIVEGKIPKDFKSDTTNFQKYNTAIYKEYQRLWGANLKSVTKGGAVIRNSNLELLNTDDPMATQAA